MDALRRAMASHQAGKFDEAEALYRSVLNVDAKQYPVLQMLGVLHAQRGNYPEAERRLNAAMALNPNDAGGQFNYGNVLLGLQRLDEAFVAFGKALALDPALAAAELNRGSILMSRKRFEDAIACFDAVIRINRNYAEAHCNRGHALEEIKRYGEALASCDAALAINPQNAEFHASRASVLHRLKRFDEALGELSVALSLQPANAGFQYNRGNILFELKRFSEAFAAYDDAFRSDPQLDYVEGDRFFTKLMICDWTNHAAESEHLVAGVAAGRAVVAPIHFFGGRFRRRQCKPAAPICLPITNFRRCRTCRPGNAIGMTVSVSPTSPPIFALTRYLTCSQACSNATTNPVSKSRLCPSALPIHRRCDTGSNMHAIVSTMRAKEVTPKLHACCAKRR